MKTGRVSKKETFTPTGRTHPRATPHPVRFEWVGDDIPRANGWCSICSGSAPRGVRVSATRKRVFRSGDAHHIIRASCVRGLRGALPVGAR